MLSEMQEVTELHPVPDAHVPVMKFKFNGVSVDLLYARLALWVIPEVSGLHFMQKQITLFWVLFLFLSMSSLHISFPGVVETWFSRQFESILN